MGLLTFFSRFPFRRRKLIAPSKNKSETTPTTRPPQHDNHKAGISPPAVMAHRKEDVKKMKLDKKKLAAIEHPNLENPNLFPLRSLAHHASMREQPQLKRSLSNLFAKMANSPGSDSGHLYANMANSPGSDRGYVSASTAHEDPFALENSSTLFDDRNAVPALYSPDRGPVVDFHGRNMAQNPPSLRHIPPPKLSYYQTMAQDPQQQETGPSVDYYQRSIARTTYSLRPIAAIHSGEHSGLSYDADTAQAGQDTGFDVGFGGQDDAHHPASSQSKTSDESDDYLEFKCKGKGAAVPQVEDEAIDVERCQRNTASDQSRRQLFSRTSSEYNRIFEDAYGQPLRKTEEERPNIKYYQYDATPNHPRGPATLAERYQTEGLDDDAHVGPSRAYGNEFTEEHYEKSPSPSTSQHDSHDTDGYAGVKNSSEPSMDPTKDQRWTRAELEAQRIELERIPYEERSKNPELSVKYGTLMLKIFAMPSDNDDAEQRSSQYEDSNIQVSDEEYKRMHRNKALQFLTNTEDDMLPVLRRRPHAITRPTPEELSRSERRHDLHGGSSSSPVGEDSETLISGCPQNETSFEQGIQAIEGEWAPKSPAVVNRQKERMVPVDGNFYRNPLLKPPHLDMAIAGSGLNALSEITALAERIVEEVQRETGASVAKRSALCMVSGEGRTFVRGLSELGRMIGRVAFEVRDEDIFRGIEEDRSKVAWKSVNRAMRAICRYLSELVRDRGTLRYVRMARRHVLLALDRIVHHWGQLLCAMESIVPRTWVGLRRCGEDVNLGTTLRDLINKWIAIDPIFHDKVWGQGKDKVLRRGENSLGEYAMPQRNITPQELADWAALQELVSKNPPSRSYT